MLRVCDLYWKLAKHPSKLSAGQIWILCEKLTGFSRTEIYTNWEQIWQGDWTSIETQLNAQYPIAYLLGEKSFYGLNFKVDSRVLIPRDETELLVQASLNWLENHPSARVLDLCSGSGICGLTIKKFFPQTQVTLSDKSVEALAVAKLNAQKYQLNVFYQEGNFLEPHLCQQLTYNLIICNPPYLERDDQALGTNLIYEPAIALFAPQNGLFFYELFFHHVIKVLDQSHSFALFLEFGYQQKERLATLLEKISWINHCQVLWKKDWNGHWRFVQITSLNEV